MNQKTIVAKVISNKAKFPEFYNSVITMRIAEELSLNLNEPYIDLILISQNSTFIAKKAKTSQARISQLENMNGNPSLSFLRRVSSALDIKFQLSV